MRSVPQDSGYTLHAPHIEEPQKEFFVAWDASAYINVLRFEAGKRWARILAQTEEGALGVARYHHFRGSNFQLLPTRPQGLKTE